MAKISMVVQLKNDEGQNIGTQILSGDQPTRSAAETVIATEIAARVAAAQQIAARVAAAQQTVGALVDAQNAFSV